MTKFGVAVASAFLGLSVACGGSSESDPAADLEGPDTAEDVSELTAGHVALRIPVLDHDGKLLSRHNKVLAAAGLDTFPDVVEIEGGTKGVPSKTAAKKWDDASALVDKAYEKLKLSLEMRIYGEPHDYQTSDPATTICYRGNPLLVVPLITNLADNVFSDQLVVHGWRYRQKKELGEDEQDSASWPSIWTSWRGQGAAVLTLTASSDDGSELNVGLIRKCP